MSNVVKMVKGEFQKEQDKNMEQKKHKTLDVNAARQDVESANASLIVIKAHVARICKVSCNKFDKAIGDSQENIDTIRIPKSNTATKKKEVDIRPFDFSSVGIKIF